MKKKNIFLPIIATVWQYNNMTDQDIKKYEEKFLSKVEKTETCWFWKNEKEKGRYGIFYCKLGAFPAHRFSYMLYNGDIPRGTFVCHNCPGGDKKACVNPNHLWIGNQSKNIQDHYKKKGIMPANDPKTAYLRTRIPYDLYRRFRLLCAEFDLIPSVTMSQAIISFCNTIESNKEFIKQNK